MDNRSPGKRDLNSVKKSAFWPVIFPLILATLLVVILALTILLNGGKNPVILENWANISVILISLLLFLPGLIFLAAIIAVNFLLGKTMPIVEQRLMKIQILAVKLNNILLAFARMVVYPFSIAKTLTRQEKIEYPLEKESVNE